MRLCQRHIISPGKIFSFSDFDPDDDGGISRKEGKKKLAKRMEQIDELHARMYADSRYSFLGILNGLDASGKGGVARMIGEAVTHPAGFFTKGFKAPKGEEREFHFIARAVPFEPKVGGVVIFDRSPYEEVTAVRVHPHYLDAQYLPELVRGLKGEVPGSFWDARIASIMRWEDQLVRSRIVVLKFFLHVSVEEQVKRFESRLKNKKKHLKFSERDVREMKFRPQTLRAWETAISRTSTDDAPWFVVPADRKWYARLIVADAIVEHLNRLDIRYPTFSKEELKGCLALLRKTSAQIKK